MDKLKILVTGANRGIGKGIIQRLLKDTRVSEITITSRSDKTAQDAVNELEKENLHNIKLKHRALDLLHNDSINAFIHALSKDSAIFDVVIMNAAMAYKSQDWGQHVRDDTMQVNYFGTINLAEKLIEGGHLKIGGRMIFTSSSTSHLKRFEINKEFYEELCHYNDEKFTEERLSLIVKRFYDEVLDKDKGKNWPQSIYGPTKLFINLSVYLFAKKYPDYKFYSFDPGYCQTDMTGWKGDKTAYDGGATAVFLALEKIDDKDNGAFFRDGKAVDF